MIGLKKDRECSMPMNSDMEVNQEKSPFHERRTIRMLDIVQSILKITMI